MGTVVCVLGQGTDLWRGPLGRVSEESSGKKGSLEIQPTAYSGGHGEGFLLSSEKRYWLRNTASSSIPTEPENQLKTRLR